MIQRNLRIILIAGGVLAAAAVWSYGYMASQQSRARTAQADLEVCLKDAAAIESYRSQPRMAAEEERLATEIHGLIERTGLAAGISPEALKRITPEAPQRLGDSPYKEKPTVLVLDEVRMESLVRLIHGLVSSEEGLHPKSIRLTAPRKNAAEDVWTAEIVLTYLIYDPLPATQARKQP